MSLKEQITSDMKDAMRSKEAERLGTIRLLLAAMKQKEVDERVELTDAHIVAIIEKMVKQRKDSITQFAAAKRDDLVLQETKELELLQTYMPTQLSDDEVMAAVQKAVKMSGATGPQDMGKVIGLLKAELAGKDCRSAVGRRCAARLSDPGGISRSHHRGALRHGRRHSLDPDRL